MKPIIIRISGGIGNQLFQYALGRALTLKSGALLLLDISSYSNQKEGDAPRMYTLDRFSIEAAIATTEDFKEIGVPDPTDNGRIAKAKRKIIRLFESRKPLHQRRIVLEPVFSFIPDILNTASGSFIAGVWQSEKYFRAFEKEIRNDFALKAPLSDTAEAIKKIMVSSESVAVHIRRGDQVSDPNLVKKHGLLTEEYYSAALKRIREKTGSPRFFIFSDEIAWVKQNMDFGPDTVYVLDDNGLNLPDYEELALMSFCKHQIIAKSSFSWWGAWLNPNPDKIVIAPRQRFASGTDASDLTPENWLLL